MRTNPHNSIALRLARRWALLAGALASTAAAPASITITAAYAGSYHLYSCAQPNNQRAPVDGWSSQVSGPNMRQSNSCASGGFLLGAIDGGPSQPVGATVSWIFSVPWYDSIRAATIWRTYVTNGSNTSAQTAAYMAAPNNAFDSLDAFDVCPAVGCGHAGATGGSRFEPADRVIVPPSNLNGAARIYVNAGCIGSGGAWCPENANAFAEVRAADITLAVDTAPSASAVGGTLTTTEKLNGPQDIQITASDSGPGIYQAIFQIDGATVASQTINPNEGRCQDVGQTTDGSAAFLYLQPCPAQVNAADVSFDPSAVSDGPHQLRVLVSDAGGDTTTILDRPVIIDNNGAYTTLITRGQCNGASCDDHAALVPAARLAARSTRTFSGSAMGLAGRLVDHTGAPIKGALVQLFEQPSELGSQLHAIQSVRTDTTGAWSFRVPRGPSRHLRVAYFSHMNDTTPASQLNYQERVYARVALRATRVAHLGQRVVFSGSLAGGYIPYPGEVVQMQIRYLGRWRTIDPVRSNTKGRFGYRYIFTIGAGSSYQFRAVVLYNPAYPFLGAASRPVRVYVKR